MSGKPCWRDEPWAFFKTGKRRGRTHIIWLIIPNCGSIGQKTMTEMFLRCMYRRIVVAELDTCLNSGFYKGSSIWAFSSDTPSLNAAPFPSIVLVSYFKTTIAYFLIFNCVLSFLISSCQFCAGLTSHIRAQNIQLASDQTITFSMRLKACQYLA